jgi:uncharacterized protein with beta-barrel porin domain
MSSVAGAGIVLTSGLDWSAGFSNLPRCRLCKIAILACALAATLVAAPRIAMAQSCTTAGTDPVSVACTNPGGAITTTNTTNSTSPSAATNARIQNFGADLIGNVTATTTVNGAGLNLVTTKAAGAITFTNDGAVTTNQGLNALQLNGNGGLVSYSGNGSAINSNNTGSGLSIVNNGGNISANTGTGTISGSDAINLSTTGAGTVTVTTGGTIGGGITTSTVNGLNTVNVTGGTVQTGGFAIDAESTGTGSVKVNMTGGQITSGLTGIVAATSGTSGDITIAAGPIKSTLESGIFASIENHTSGGAVRVDVNGAISAAQDGVLAGANSGAVTVNVNNDIMAGGRGVDAAGDGAVTANQTAGIIHSVGNGIDVGSLGIGNVVVSMSGGQIGASGNAVGGAGIFAQHFGTAGDINITAGNIFSVGDGIYARIGNTGDAGNINVAVASGSAVTVGPTGTGRGIFAETLGAGNIGITVNGNVTTTKGNGIDAEITRDPFDPQSGTGSVSVTNNASVTAGGSFAGLYIAGGTANTVQNNASITGDVGLRVNGGTTSLINLGTITGAGGTALQIDSGTLQLMNGNGTLVGNIVNNGVFAVNRTQAWTFSGVISGAGEFQQVGPGTTILSGMNTYTGPTNVNAGVLAVDGSIGSSSLTTVNTGAALTGLGIVGNTTIANGGLLMPGNGTPGTTLTVSGNLAFQSGALYLVQLNPTASSLVNVAGKATLGNATVQANFTTGSYIARQYTILTASGGIDGTFGSVVNFNAPPNLATSLSYDSSHVYLNLGLAVSLLPGLNVNQKNVADALTRFFDANGGIPAVFATLSPTGLTQASGELATGTQQATFNAMSMFMSLLTDPFVSGRGSNVNAGGTAQPYAEEDSLAYAAKKSDARSAFAKIPTKAEVARNNLLDNRWSVWGSAFGGGADIRGNAAVGSNDANARAFGFAVGADYRISPATIAGFALAGGGTNFSVNGFGYGRSDMFQAGAFVRHTVGAAYVTGALAYGAQDVTTDRYVTAAGLDHLRAQFNSNAWSGRIEGGYRYATPWMGITPYAAAQFTTIDLPAYAEQVIAGTGNFALNYNARTVTDPRTELGIRTDRSFAMDNGILTLRGRLAWAHDYNTDRNVTPVFQALPGTFFVVNGAAQAHDSALTTASAEMKWLNGWSAAATFEGEFSNVMNSYAGKGVVRYAW